MEGLETSHVNAENDDFSLIDVIASDDDFLLASSSEPNMMDNPGHIVKGVPTTQPSDSSDLQKPRKSGKCNLRKSLAWDSAFFTNSGVLDPEELSSIIEGVGTGVKQNLILPGIQEELSKSTDSTSSFQSDNVMLKSLEDDLFSDIRASIQKCSKSSITGNDRDSGTLGEDESKNASSKQIVEPSSSKLAKPKLASNKLNSGVPGSVKSVMKPPVNCSRDPGSLPSRPLKAPSGPCTTMKTTTKRISVDAGRVKQDMKTTGNVKGKAASPSEAFHKVDSRKPLPKASSMSKASATSSVPTKRPLAKAPAVPKVSTASSVLTNRTATHSSRSSCDSSNSFASEDIQKSQAGVVRRKPDKNGNLPSGSKIRSLSKAAEKVKPQNNGSHLSAYVKSTAKVSSSISPASSISEWSTESSSSTATANQKQFGLSRCSPSSQEVIVENNSSQNLQNSSSDKALDVCDNKVPGTPGQSVKQSSTEGAASNKTNIRSGFAKPSGLRLPSPNIGFFDGAKAGAKTPSSSTALPKSVTGSISSSGTTNRTKLSPNASKMTKAAAETAKPKYQVTDGNPKTASPLPDLSNDLENLHIDADPETSDGPGIIPPKPALER